MGGKNTPDFGDVAASQGEENEKVVRDQLYANRPTQYTPWGYTNWQNERVIDPGTGQPTTKWTQTQGLTPELQEMLNKQMALQGGRTDLAGGLVGRMGEEFGTPMNWEGLTPLQSTPQTQLTMPEGGLGDPYQTRQRAEDAMYNSAMSRLQPQFDSRRQALEIKMRNQGLSPGDEAWNAQMGNLQQQETDATQQAIWGATGEGRAESGQMFGQQLAGNQNMYNQILGSNQQNFQQSMQAANYANQIRQQQMAEAMQQRGFSLNEINALLSGQQVGMPQMPSFTNAQAAQPAPIMTGAAQQASIEQAQSPWSALGGLAGQALGAYTGAGGTFGLGG
jgi:hypothetical protein